MQAVSPQNLDHLELRSASSGKNSPRSLANHDSFASLLNTYQSSSKVNFLGGMIDTISKVNAFAKESLQKRGDASSNFELKKPQDNKSQDLSAKKKDEPSLKEEHNLYDEVEELPLDLEIANLDPKAYFKESTTNTQDTDLNAILKDRNLNAALKQEGNFTYSAKTPTFDKLGENLRQDKSLPQFQTKAQAQVMDSKLNVESAPQKVSSTQVLDAMASEVNVQKLSIKNINLTQQVASSDNLGVNLENLESFKAQDLEVFNQKQILNDVTQSKFIESEKSNSQTSMYVTQNDKAGTGTSQNPQSSSVTLNAQSTLEKIKNSLEGSKPQALQKAALHLGAGSLSVEQANLKTQANVNVQKAQNLNTNAQNVESVEESLDLFNIFTPQEEGILSGTVSKEGTLNSSSSLTQALNLLNPALSRLNSLSAQGGMAQNFNSQSSLNGNSQSALTQALHQSLNMSQDVDENTQNVTQMVMAMAARNLKSLTIDLNPSSLGQMTISLALSSKGTPLKVSVDAKNLSTKNLISKMLPKLNDSLQERGFGAKVSLVDSSASKASLWSELFA